MDDMKKAATKRIGHGGIKCRCCRRGPKRYAQTNANRVARRALKAEVAAWDDTDPTLLINILKDE